LGLVQGLAQAGFGPQQGTKIWYDNAQGNVALGAQMAKRFAGKKPQVLVAIGTQVAQSAQHEAQRYGIPLVFASVTNPVSAGLVTQLSQPGGWVTGTRNVPKIQDLLALLHQLLPAVRTLGVVVNPAEQNTLDMLSLVQDGATAYGWTVHTSTANSSTEVATALQALVTKVDALLLLQDNTVASALPAFMKVASEQHKPVLATYTEALAYGALAAVAANEYRIGLQTAQLVVSILQGQAPGSLDVTDPAVYDTVINPVVAAQHGIRSETP
jgi:putative ABC transport system substrate-binding protein